MLLCFGFPISLLINARLKYLLLHAMMRTKKKKNNGNPMTLLSPRENGFWSATGGSTRQLGMIKPKNARWKRLQIRRLKYTTRQTNDRGHLKKGQGDDNEGSNLREEANEGLTEMSLSLSCSSSSDQSSGNNDVLTTFEDRKACKVKERVRGLTSVSHGLVSVIGRRREMEDAVRVEVGFVGGKGNEKYDFFAVYDGHGGSRVAEACKERLHILVMEMIAKDQNEGISGIGWERVMEGSFEKMDEEVNRGRLREDMVGSTAVVAVVGKNELVVANCGDSRAVLFRDGVAVPLSIDHKPDRPDEMQRVESAGGRVINWNGYRILGVLATSRSIGDQYLKPFVTSKPEVTVTERNDRDEFLILASDGLWDVVSNEVACQVVRRCFSGHLEWASSLEVVNENRATRAAYVLAELAIARGSSDNISVIVVELKNHFSFF